jgi:hypothetical protein
MGEDDFIYWQDALELVQSGRPNEIKCPFCHDGDVKVTQRERTTRLQCTRCGQFIEGRFSNEE